MTDHKFTKLNFNFQNENPAKLAQNLKNLKNADLSKYSNKDIMKIFHDICPVSFMANLSDAPACYRAQIIDPNEPNTENGKAKTLGRLSAPKPGKQKFNRCNTTNESVFYAAANLETSLLEIDATCSKNLGKLIQVLEIEEKKRIIIQTNQISKTNTAVIGLVDYFRRTGRVHSILRVFEKELEAKIKREFGGFDGHLTMLHCLVDAFIADIFIRPANKVTKSEYAITAAYSQNAFTNAKVKQIIYPSSRYNGGYCIAIDPDNIWSRYKVRNIYTLKILEYYGYGLFKLINVHKGDVKDKVNISDNTEIQWTELKS